MTTASLTIQTIDNAMKGNDFWLNRESEAARIVTEATRRGYIRRHSWTQVEWMEAGLAKARAELEPAPSPFLSERLISRLSPQRRANLMSRVRGHLHDAMDAVSAISGSALSNERVKRTTRMLGRLSALTA